MDLFQMVLLLERYKPYKNVEPRTITSPINFMIPACKMYVAYQHQFKHIITNMNTIFISHILNAHNT